MASPYEDPSVTIFGEYLASDKLTVASFVWPTPNTVETYTIAPNPSLSLEFDRHFPIRLASIVLYDAAPEGATALIEHIAGRELREEMRQVPFVGQFVLNTAINLKNRLVLADIQANSLSTPPPVRRAVLVMMQANQAIAKNARHAVPLTRPSASGGGVLGRQPAGVPHGDRQAVGHVPS